MKSQIDIDTFNGQFDSLIAGAVKPRGQYQGNYESYLRGVSQAEQRQQPEKENNNANNATD